MTRRARDHTVICKNLTSLDDTTASMGDRASVRIEKCGLPLIRKQQEERRPCLASGAYFPCDTEQWLAADFHVPDSFTQVSLQITDLARCVPLKVASYVNV
jgi:hypothetical protein